MSSQKNVYAVVSVDRGIRARSVVDSQEDVLILAVFTEKSDANRYILNRGLGKNIMIHVVELDPGINTGLNSSL
jgi:hypothetical protein